MDEDHDQPIEQRLRLVRLMDCVPGRAVDPENGPPIAILTLSHKSEIEQPLMMYLGDARKLAADLLTILHEFDDPEAAKIFAAHMVPGKHGSWVLVGDGPPDAREVPSHMIRESRSISVSPSSSAPVAPSLPATGLALTVRLRDPKLKPLRFAVVGGYRDGNDVYLLLRCPELGDAAETLAKLGPARIITLNATGDEVLRKEWWRGFTRMKSGQQIWIGGRIWKKLGRNELGKMSRDVYTQCKGAS